MGKVFAKLTGVHKAEVNYVAGSATVVYDETVTDLKTIKVRVHECGYLFCTGMYEHFTSKRSVAAWLLPVYTIMFANEQRKPSEGATIPVNYGP